MSLTRKQILIYSGVLVGTVLGTTLIIKLAQGYRFDLNSQTLLPHGILAATSNPNGAQLWLNGKLKSATDDNLNLAPNEYEVEIKKDGYFPWKKKLSIKKELVTQTNAYLFSTFPDLKALTFTGAANPLLSPDGQKVVFTVNNASTSKQGLWVLDLADRPLGLSRSARQIIISSKSGLDFASAEYRWSPDSKQLLVTLAMSKLKKQSFLLDSDRLNSDTTLIDISLTVELLIKRWQEEEQQRLESQLGKLPLILLETIKDKVKEIQFSPDESKIIYTATASATIPDKIIAPLPVTSTQPESRQIEAGKIYVYDLKEDKNFSLSGKAGSPSPVVSWFPTSKHIFVVQSGKISITEFDGTNWADVYTGPFENSFAFPFPDGSRLLILASIGKDTPSNLYAVRLR